MKKILLLLAFLFSFVQFSQAASTQTEATFLDTEWIKGYSITWTAHTDGTYTNYTMTNAINGAVWFVVTDPGATAPTDNYDIALLDSTGIDVMGGALDNRDTANTEQEIPKTSSGNGFIRPVKGKLTLTISNNLVNGAGGVVYIYVYPNVNK